MDESTGEQAAHWYPYHDEEGTVVGYKCRTLPKDFTRGVVGKLRGFFGKKQCKGHNFLIICEGEMDCLAAHEAMRTLGKGPYNVVSIPDGAQEEGTLTSTVKKELEWLSSFKKIVICLDNDAAGKAYANALADYLCSHTDVRIANLPLKDTAAMHEAGRHEEWGRAINQAEKYVSDQIVLGTDNFDELLEPLTEGVHFSFLPETSRRLHGFRSGEITGLLATVNVGKSSLMRQGMHELLCKGKDPVGGFFLEERVKKTKQAIISYQSDIPLNVFRKNPSLAKPEKIEEARELLSRLHLFEHKQKVLTDDFLERKIEYMVKALGCKHIFLDHLSFIIGGRDGGNERKEIDMLMTRLARSVEDWDYSLFLVSHIKRPDNAKPQPKTFPYWDRVDLRAGRGSGAIEALCHKIIGLDNEIVDEDRSRRGMIRTNLLRDREWGAIGVCDHLTWNTTTGKYEPVDVEV